MRKAIFLLLFLATGLSVQARNNDLSGLNRYYFVYQNYDVCKYLSGFKNAMNVGYYGLPNCVKKITTRDFDSDGEPASYEFWFDEEGRLAYYIDSSKIVKYEYDFDGKDKIKERRAYLMPKKELISVLKYERDEQNRVVYAEETLTEDYAYEFEYKNGSLVSIIEQLEEPNEFGYDEVRYKLNRDGDVYEARAQDGSLFSSWKLFLAYDYDKEGRLKAVRNFADPDDTKIYTYDEKTNSRICRRGDGKTLIADYISIPYRQAKRATLSASR